MTYAGPKETRTRNPKKSLSWVALGKEWSTLWGKISGSEMSLTEKSRLFRCIAQEAHEAAVEWEP